MPLSGNIESRRAPQTECGQILVVQFIAKPTLDLDRANIRRPGEDILHRHPRRVVSVVLVLELSHRHGTRRVDSGLRCDDALIEGSRHRHRLEG